MKRKGLILSGGWLGTGMAKPAPLVQIFELSFIDYLSPSLELDHPQPVMPKQTTFKILKRFHHCKPNQENSIFCCQAPLLRYVLQTVTALKATTTKKKSIWMWIRSNCIYTVVLVQFKMLKSCTIHYMNLSCFQILKPDENFELNHHFGYFNKRFWLRSKSSNLWKAMQIRSLH